MCGIFGFNFNNEILEKKMLKILKLRGPDDFGIWKNDKITLGHTRLSIIDLTSRAHQPMVYKEFVIIYNGEIYNYNEIKKDLIKKGIKFESESDTEVILKGFSVYKEKIFNKLNGMWAIAIYNEKTNEVILSRDRFGIKPLYYYLNKKDKTLIFSSEPKAILESKRINKIISRKAIYEYLMFRGALYEDSFFEGIKKVPPATFVKIELKDLNSKSKKYFRLKNSPKIKSETLAVKMLDNFIKKSIKYRLISDVGVGTILSGGLDSSLVTAIANKYRNINSYNVHFENEESEDTKYATILAKKLKIPLKIKSISLKEFTKKTKEYQKLKSEPVGVPNEVALFSLSKLIRRNKDIVVLSGEGSDEIFYGYDRLFSLAMNETPNKFFTALSNKYPYIPINEINSVIKIISIPKLFNSTKRHFIGDTTANKFSNWMIGTHLPILLNRVDNSTMFNAVESRVPFLDHNIVSFAIRLKDELKLNLEKKISKYILKVVAKKYLPTEIINRKKVGFPVPFKEWKDEILEQTLRGNLHPIFNEKEVNKMISRIRTNRNSTNYEIQRLWMIKNLNNWLFEKEKEGYII